MSQNNSGIGEILWQPSPERIGAANLPKFARNFTKCNPNDTKFYQNLHHWSVTEPESYHSALWDHLDIIGSKGEKCFIPGDSIVDAKFFPDAALNYAENLLRDPDERIAVIAHTEDGTRREVTRHQLHAKVSRIVKALRADGIGPGDRIAAITTNDLEALEIYQASAAIGAIWASCSPDFGPGGASDRLNQIKPKILVAVPHYQYGGKHFEISETINAVAATSSVKRVIILGELPGDTKFHKPAITIIDWLAPFAPGEINYFRAPFDLPMLIVFSSGTTGKPKCIIHRAGGVLLQHKKEHALHCDIGEGDVVFYFSTCGWMMWNWQISALASRATLVTYDGNPMYPGPDRLIDLIDSEHISVFGTSAKYIDACSKAGLKPKQSHKLRALKTILSTGSTLLPESFDYIYRDWKSDIHLASISGGTDICGCFVGGVPTSPVRRGEIQGPMLGMDVQTLGEDSKPVTKGAGELVCRAPHITMPLGFWNDQDGSRYHDAYFATHDGVWAQSDFIEKCESGGYVITGRSDATLNPGGVRIGTAEIYRQVESFDEVLEAVAVGREIDQDQRIILFLRLKAGRSLDADLEKRLRHRIRNGATPRHLPAEIIAVPDIPRTRSGKISEIAVREAIHGRELKNTSALANADCLAFYRDWAQRT